MAEGNASVAALRFGRTMRRDLWWLQPLLTAAGLGAFIVYATWAAFQGRALPLRPLPLAVLLAGALRRLAARLVRAAARRWPAWLPFSPALLILWAPGGFRFTCYYYRGAYYKAFWADPPVVRGGRAAQAATAARRAFPLILQNVHRYFLYLALLVPRVPRATTSGRRSGSPIRRPARTSFGIGVGHARARGQRRPARRLHARLPLAAPPRRRRARRALARRPLRTTAYGCVERASTGATCCGPG